MGNPSKESAGYKGIQYCKLCPLINSMNLLRVTLWSGRQRQISLLSHDLYFSHDAFFAEMPERVFLDIQNINWFAECALMDKLCNMNWEISNIIYQSDSNTVHSGLIFHIWNTVQTQSLRKQYYCSVVIKWIKIIQSTFKKKTKNTKTTTKP